MTAQENADREQKIRQVADKILQLAYDGLLINMRFLDVALSRLPVTCRAGMGAHVFDGAGLTCDPLLLIRQKRGAGLLGQADCICTLFCTQCFTTVFRQTG